MTTHFNGGVSNITDSTNPMYTYGGMDPTQNITFFTDFLEYASGDWTETATGTSTLALTTGAGGIGLVTTGATENDGLFAQLPSEAYLFDATKTLIFRMRFAVSEATQSDFVAGLQITDTTPLDASDGIYFISADGSAAIDFVVKKNGTASTYSAVATAVDDTYVTLAFVYDPRKGNITYYVNDVPTGTAVTTNAPDDQTLTVSFGLISGAAGAQTMSVDYIFASNQR